jgi:hypothetical protein
MAPQSTRCPSDTLQVPSCGTSEAPSEEQAPTRNPLLTWSAGNRGSPRWSANGLCAYGAVLYALSWIQGRPIGELIGLSGIPMGALVALLGLRGAAKLPLLQHYSRIAEEWLNYRIGRISPKQHFKYVANLEYDRRYSHLPPDARPSKDAFVLEEVQWRMEQEQRKRMGWKAEFSGRYLSTGPPGPDPNSPGSGTKIPMKARLRRDPRVVRRP